MGGSSRPTSRAAAPVRPPRRRQRRRRPPAGPAGRADRDGPRPPRARQFRSSPAAADGRATDGRVEGDRAALLPDVGDRHDAAAVEARARIKAAAAEGEVVPSFNDMVVKACALALREFPRANGAYRDGASSSTRGSTSASRSPRRTRSSSRPSSTPTARACGRSPPIVAALAAAGPRRQRSRRRSSRAAPSPSPTWGCSESTSFSAVINPPQAAILAVGAIDERPSSATARSSRRT